jgi:hypothetical protein
MLDCLFHVGLLLDSDRCAAATCCVDWAAYVLHTHASDQSAVEASTFIIRRACGVATHPEGYMRMVPDLLWCMQTHSGCAAVVEQVCSICCINLKVLEHTMLLK